MSETKGNSPTADEVVRDYVNMDKEQLLQEINKLEGSAQTLKDQQFIDANSSEMVTIMRLRSDQDRKEWAECVLDASATKFNILQARLYIVEQQDAKSYLRPIGSFSYAGPEELIQFGDGMVGQAAKSKRQLSHNNTDGAIQIKSGMANVKGHKLLVCPLIANDKVEGVLEIILGAEFTSVEQKLLDRVCEGIANCLNQLTSQAIMQGMLLDSQENAQRLASQEEELRQNMEEMQTTRDELDRQKQVTEEKLAFANALFGANVDAVIVIDSSGNMENFNGVANKMFGYDESEVVGKNVKMLMTSAHQSKHDMYLDNYHKTGQKKVIGTSGRQLPAQRKDGSEFMIELFVNEFVISGNKKNIAFIRDITERLKNEEEAKKS